MKSSIGASHLILRNNGLDNFLDSVGSHDRRGVRPSGNTQSTAPAADSAQMTPDHFSEPALRHRLLHSDLRVNRKKRLRVLKFGGTSVGNAPRIENVVEIIRAASREGHVVVVVSAMSGVTNKLIVAATESAAGNRERSARILDELRKQHDTTAGELIHSAGERNRIGERMRELFQEGERVCRETAALGELTLRARDFVSGLGERFSVLLVAGALVERGVPSEAVEATGIIVTDEQHGGAEPKMGPTRERCDERLRPLVQRGIVPVVTGFIGATNEGVLTTLGRGSSDYSATILGAALNAYEVVIWSDVDGVLTADPRSVPGACTIPEMSYHEAAELAYFGAKVLHPKTLRPLQQSEIPLRIRNSFAPERAGTKITPDGHICSEGVKAVTAKSDVAVITVGGAGMAKVKDALSRTFAAAADVRAEVLLISQSSAQNEICFVVPSATSTSAVEALRREFAADVAPEDLEKIAVDHDVAIVTVVGQNLGGSSGIAGRTFGALGREKVNVIAIAQGSSECNLSFLVAHNDVKAALIIAHREFLPSAQPSQTNPANTG
jgi:bifunctional aspartokinase / homoserine dehydrogenase 1